MVPAMVRPEPSLLTTQYSNGLRNCSGRKNGAVARYRIVVTNTFVPSGEMSTSTIFVPSAAGGTAPQLSGVIRMDTPSGEITYTPATGEAAKPFAKHGVKNDVPADAQ